MPLVGDAVPVRFIPACAGSTLSGEKTALSTEVHPRMRGVHLGTH